MLVYEKVINGERHVYATNNAVPSESDQVAVYKDLDGDVITLNRNDTYVNNDMHGITRKSDDKAFGVFVAGEQKAIIPEGWEPSQKIVKSIRVKTKPYKLVYELNETLDLTGIVVEATYMDGDKVDVTEYVTVPAEGTALTEPGDVTITVTYMEKNTTFKVTVNPAP